MYLFMYLCWWRCPKSQILKTTMHRVIICVYTFIFLSLGHGVRKPQIHNKLLNNYYTQLQKSVIPPPSPGAPHCPQLHDQGKTITKCMKTANKYRRIIWTCHYNVSALWGLGNDP